MKTATFFFVVAMLTITAISGCNQSGADNRETKTLTKAEFEAMSFEKQIKLMESYGVTSFSEMNLHIAKGEISK